MHWDIAPVHKLGIPEPKTGSRIPRQTGFKPEFGFSLRKPEYDLHPEIRFKRNIGIDTS